MLATSRAKAKTSAAAQAGSHLYQLKGWKTARRRWLQVHPLCVDCASLGLVVEAKEVDHIEPHRGDVVKFWDRKNWQGLCKPCHSRKTAHEVFHGRKGGGVV